MNKQKTPFWKYVARLIALPFILGIFSARYIFHVINMSIRFIVDGGELVILDTSIKTYLTEAAKKRESEKRLKTEAQ